MASFDELMKQVANLQAENTNLRRELRHNSSHISQLETEACSMKDVLTHLHTAIQDDDSPSDESHAELHSFTAAETADNSLTADNCTTAENMTAAENLITADNSFMQAPSADTSTPQTPMLDHNSNASEDPQPAFQSEKLDTAPAIQATSHSTTHSVTQSDVILNQDSNLNELPRASSVGSGTDDVITGLTDSAPERPSNEKVSREASPTDEAPSLKKHSGDKDLYSYFTQLHQQRKTLAEEVEKEDRQRQWYADQLSAVQQQADELINQGNNPAALRELEFKRERLVRLMREALGSEADVTSRHEARLVRVRRIEAEMLRVQQYHKQSKSQSDEKPAFSFQDGVFVGAPVSSKQTANQSGVATDPSGIFIGGKQITLATQTTTETPSNQYNEPLETTTTHHDNEPSNQNLATLYHGSWPIERAGSGDDVSVSAVLAANQETASVMSFHTNNSSSTCGASPAHAPAAMLGGKMAMATGSGFGGLGHVSAYASQPQQQQQQQQLGTKVEMVYGLLSMLGTHDKDDMSRTLLAMSSSQDSCIAMRQSGCLPLLIQLLHGSDTDTGLLGKTRGSKAARARASAALHNIVHSHPDDKRGRREARVLRLLEQIRAHWDQLREERDDGEATNSAEPRVDMDHHPGPAIAALMKLSFDEEHRHAICTLGGLQAIAELLLIDHEVNGNTLEQYNITMRRYACMALTNLTFGDGTNKALLCSMKQCMCALVAQLMSPNEDLRQVAASVLRNLSWRADLASKKTLREVGTVRGLMLASMQVEKESTLKSVLSALWNLSAHCSENKQDICGVGGSLAFLVTTLTYKSPTKTLSIIENGGGILRNISSHIAVREEHRQTLRHHGCLQILLKHLRSPSLTIVSNACGTLWNLSARCAEDQRALWEMGAVGMLKNLVNSKHKMISMGSAAALKNLLNAKPSLGLENIKAFPSNAPGLHMRKQRALEAELDPNLAETCENMESPTDSPTHTNKRNDARNNKLKLMYPDSAGVYGGMTYSHQGPLQGHASRLMQTSSDAATFMSQSQQQPPIHNRPVSRSGSQDSVGSVHSDISHDRTRLMLYKTSKMLEQRQNGSLSPYRNNSRSRSGSRDRSHGDHPNRIMKVMNEVAKHSGLDPNKSGGAHLLRNTGNGHDPTGNQFKESHSAENTPAVARRSHHHHNNASFHEMPPPASTSRYGNTAPAAPSGVSRGNGSSGYEYGTSHSSHSSKPRVDVASLSRNMEKLHLSLKEATSGVSDNDDQPVNYSMKYADNQTTIATTKAAFTTSYNSAFRPNTQKVNNYTSLTPGSKPPAPQINNYTSLTHSANGHTALAHAKQQHHKRISRDQGSTNQQAAHQNNGQSKHWNANDVTPTADEQPTDFSMRYQERDDTHALAGHDEQPVNYSTRYTETPSELSPEKNYVTESQRGNQNNTGVNSQGMQFQQHISSMDDDTVRTFCTEGTPLNFLSTATSLTDLSKIDDRGNVQNNTGNKANSTGSHDLDGSRDEIKNYASRDAEMEHSSSVTESHSTERDTNSTVVENQTGPNGHIHGNNTTRGSPPSSDKGSNSVGHSQVPSLYSYNDNSSVSASPSEKPTKYCTEGTPLCFSRVSSLSSLHSGHDDSLNGTGQQQQNKNNADLTLQAIDENSSLDTSLHNQTLKDESMMKAKSGNDSASQCKTVTFDNNFQVQETPLVFSRCSSPGSLSSFDVHSIHSSVMSEYSRRTSGICSPSELPDSPSDTMPPSPSHRKSPTPALNHVTSAPAMMQMTSSANTAAMTPLNNMRINPAVLPKSQHMPLPHVIKSSLPHMSKAAMALATASAPVPIAQQPNATPESTKVYADEDLPGFSCASSLSALTFDDEPSICKEANLRRIPLGEEDGMSEKHSDKQSDKTGSQKDSPVNETIIEEDENEVMNEIKKAQSHDPDKDDVFDDEDDGNSSVSEGEEQELQECIMIAMPPSSKKKMHKSVSDNTLAKTRASAASTGNGMATGNRGNASGSIPRSATTPYHLNISLSNTLESAGSSNLGLNSGSQQRPLSRHVSHDYKSQSTHFNQAPHVPRAHTVATMRAPPPHGSDYQSGFDSPRKYMTEGTPLEFSRATSLSDLTVDHMSDAGHQEKKDMEKPVSRDYNVIDDDKSDASSLFDSGDDGEEDLLSEAIEAAMPKSKKPAKPPVATSAALPRKPVNAGSSSHAMYGMTPQQQRQHVQNVRFQNKTLSRASDAKPPNLMGYGQDVQPAPMGDNMKSYAVEGTPLNFSRSESLSDLSDMNSICDDTTALKQRHKSATDYTLASRDSQPAMTSQRDAAVLRMQSKEDVIEGYGEHDTMKSYAVEDTPYNFSRRTSLSALSIPADDAIHDDACSEASSANNPAEVTVIQRTIPKTAEPPIPTDVPISTHAHHEDAIRSYAVEDTPYNFSRRTSLSDLSEMGKIYDDDEPLPPPPPPEQLQHHHYMGQEDGIRSYAVEDTPYNFSRRTSLSALSMPDDIPSHDHHHDDSENTQVEESANVSSDTAQDVTMFLSKPDNLPPVQSGFDSPRVFGLEGTPLNFSRNDSLSSLDSEDFGDDNKSSRSLNNSGRRTPSSTKQHPRKSGIQSPAITRLRTPQKLFKHPPTMHSTPMPNKSATNSPGAAAAVSDNRKPGNDVIGDAVQSFAVEDTPAVFSRNDSLSSLESGDHEGLANRSNESAENAPHLNHSNDSDSAAVAGQQEHAMDTLQVQPSHGQNRSHNSSLSSLSVESLSFEPSESESALLEECISSAMPKSVRKLKRRESGSRLPRHSPSGASKHNTPTRAHQNTPNQVTTEQGAEAADANGSYVEEKTDVCKEVTDGEKQSYEKVQDKTEEGQENVQTKQENDQEHIENLNNNNIIGSPTRPQVNLLTDGATSITSAQAEASALEETFATLETQFAELGVVGGANNGHVTGSKAMTSSTCSSKLTYNMESSEEDVSRLSQISTATKDLCGEAKHMVDVIQREKETAPSDQSTDSLETSSGRHGAIETDHIIPDIMKESFPEMTSSLISNITTPDKESLPAEMMILTADMSANISHASSGGRSEYSGNTTVVAASAKTENDSKAETSNTEKGDVLNMTDEEERALAENANIVLTCMAANQMSCSNVSDDAFIDQEVLSLVSSSGGVLSDSDHLEVPTTPRGNLDSTATQDSETTIQGRTPSGYEEFPEFDVADGEAAEENATKVGPRITKPAPGAAQENSPKGVRGGKKVIKGRPPPANGSKIGSPSGWKAPESKTISPKTQTTKKQATTKSPARPNQISNKTPTNAQRKSNQSPTASTNKSSIVSPRQKEATQSTRVLKKPTTRSPPQVSPKPSTGIPGRGSPRSSRLPSVTSPVAKEAKKRDSIEGVEPLQKQGTFVKDDSSYSLASSDATTVRYRTPTGSNRNSCEIPSTRSSFDNISSNRSSAEIKYSQSANEFRNSRPRNGSSNNKSPDEKISPTKSEKSDHGCFTVEGFAGAWEESSFSVCDYTGAWEDARRMRHKSGESGSGSNTETPPTHRRSIVLDPEGGIIEDSYMTNNDVFQPEQSPEPTAIKSTKITPPTKPKPSQIARPNSASRLPQSRLPGPRLSSGLPRPASNTSLTRSSSSGSASSLNRVTSSSPRPISAKPATPPRSSSLEGKLQRDGVARGLPRAITPPQRTGTPPRTGSTVGRPVSPLAKAASPRGSSGSPAPRSSNISPRIATSSPLPRVANGSIQRRSPLSQTGQVTPRKGSVESNASSRSNTPQSRKSSIAKPTTATVAASKQSATKPAVSAVKPAGKVSAVSGTKPPAAKPSSQLPAKKPTGSKIAGFLRKNKPGSSSTESSKSCSTSSTMQTSLIRSGTYEKLDTEASAAETTTAASSAEEEARKAKEKRAAKVKLWRQTYTIPDQDKDEDSSVSGSMGDVTSQNDVIESGEEGGGAKKSRIRRSGLFRRSKTTTAKEGESNAPVKDKSDAPKKRFSLWRKNSSDKNENKTDDVSPLDGPASVAEKSKHGLWRKRRSNIENDMNSPNSELPLANGAYVKQNGDAVTPTQVVQPFNYLPASAPNMLVASSAEMIEDTARMPPPASVPPAPAQNSTKTQMLLARRRHTSSQNGGSSTGSETSLDGAGGDGIKKNSFLVTTV